MLTITISLLWFLKTVRQWVSVSSILEFIIRNGMDILNFSVELGSLFCFVIHRARLHIWGGHICPEYLENYV